MPQFPGRSFDRILLDTHLIDAAQHRQLVAAFNQRVKEHRSKPAPRPAPKQTRRPNLRARGLTDSDVLLSIPDDDEDLDLEVPDDVFAEPTVVLKDEEPDPPLILKADSDQGDVFAQPTLVLNDDDEGDEDVFAQPTLVLNDDDGGGDEDVFAQPTLVLNDDDGGGDEDVFAQPTLVLDDDKDGDANDWGELDLAPKQTSDIGDVDMRLQRDVNKSSARLPALGAEDTDAARSLNSVEFQRRLKGRQGFDGFKIGDYKIRGEIARGAFGVVLRADPGGVTKTLANDRGYAGTLALKVALENTADPRATERFVEETRVQISFDHPHIVRIFDCGVEAGLTYYSMEKVEGIDARSYVLKSGPMPPLLAVRVVKEIALALSYVHKKRIYHRDLKPQNVLLDKACKPYRAVLIDFGLVTEHLSEADKGLILGTPSYMPPEQAQPRGGHGTINLTSDIYSLGATFFFLLTGKAPFTDKNPRKIIKMVVGNDPPDPVALNDKIPRRIADICLKCLEKRQRDRYHSAAQLVADLDKELKSGQLKLKAKSFFGRFLGKKK